MTRSSLVVLALVMACDHAVDDATSHLLTAGYRDVQCSPDGVGRATCSVGTGKDMLRFHCVTHGSSGCDADAAMACERYYIEKPEPVSLPAMSPQ